MWNKATQDPFSKVSVYNFSGLKKYKKGYIEITKKIYLETFEKCPGSLCCILITASGTCNFDAYTTQVLFKSVHVPFHVNDSVVQFLLLMERVVEVFPAIITLLSRVSFSFFRSPNLASITLSFSKNSLLTLINSVCFDIRFSYTFMLKPISYSLVIF